MKYFICTFLLAFVSLSLAAEDFTIKIDGKEIKLSYTAINHEITENDKELANQNSAEKCSFLFYKLLADGQIEKASKLSTDPEKAKDKWAKYSERLGSGEFKESMDNYFTDKFIVIAEIVNNSEYFLVVQPPDGKDYSSIQMYQKKDGLFFVDDTPSEENLQLMGELLPQIQDGTLDLKKKSNGK